ncbi:unnamed protein product, partial [Didymodactylos carnosus]
MPLEKCGLLHLKQDFTQTNDSHQDDSYEVISLESKLEMEKKSKLQLVVRNQQNRETSSDDDEEPMASGFGDVSKECAEDILVKWNDILSKWRKDNNERPPELQALIII